MNHIVGKYNFVKRPLSPRTVKGGENTMLMIQNGLAQNTYSFNGIFSLEKNNSLCTGSKH